MQKGCHWPDVATLYPTKYNDAPGPRRLLRGPRLGRLETEALEPALSERRGQEGEQVPCEGRLFAAAQEGGGVANGRLRGPAGEEDAAMARCMDIAAVHQADIGLAGFNSGQNDARIIEEKGALPNRVPQAKRLQISAAVTAQRTGGIGQSNAMHRLLQQSVGAGQLGDARRGSDCGQAIGAQGDASFGGEKTGLFQAIKWLIGSTEEEIDVNPPEDMIGQFVGSAADGPHGDGGLLDGKLSEQAMQDIFQAGSGGDVDPRGIGRQRGQRRRSRLLDTRLQGAIGGDSGTPSRGQLRPATGSASRLTLHQLFAGR